VESPSGAVNEDLQASAPLFDHLGSDPGPASAGGAAGAVRLMGGLFENLSNRVRSAGGSGGIQLGPSHPPEVQQVSVATPSSPQHVQFLVPGQVVHLYHENGLTRAAIAAANHESLARIMPCQNMLDDHKTSAYVEALEQACIVQPKTPTWESFDDRKVCACCNADFSWAFVLQSEAQKMLSRHHCFACGRVVCDGCSRKRLSHERLGFPMPVRTCDTCVFAKYEGADEAMAAAASEERAALEAAEDARIQGSS